MMNSSWLKLNNLLYLLVKGSCQSLIHTWNWQLAHEVCQNIFTNYLFMMGMTINNNNEMNNATKKLINGQFWWYCDIVRNSTKNSCYTCMQPLKPSLVLLISLFSSCISCSSVSSLCCCCLCRLEAEESNWFTCKQSKSIISIIKIRI